MRSTIVGRATACVVRAARLLVRDPADAVLSARMAGWVVLVSGAARLLPMHRAHALVSARVRRPRGTPPADTAQQLARAIDRVLRTAPFRSTGRCWRRALVLHRFLALRGIDSRVTFGVRTTGGALAGHAWLERDGQPFLEDDVSSYVVTFSLPRRPTSWEPCSRS